MPATSSERAHPAPRRANAAATAAPKVPKTAPDAPREMPSTHNALASAYATPPTTQTSAVRHGPRTPAQSHAKTPPRATFASRCVRST